MKKCYTLFNWAFLICACAASTFALAETTDTLLQVQQQWAKANYELSGKEQVAAFETLISSIQKKLDQHPKDADMHIWLGISQSTLAGAKGGLGALSLAKASRAALESALAIAPEALDGSAYTSLGTLYHKVPGWPLGFGDDKKARQLLETALEINPKGIDPNYFYAEFLYDEKDYTEAKAHLLTAQAAAPRPGRPLADQGRRKEIEELLRKVEKKLQK